MKERGFKELFLKNKTGQFYLIAAIVVSGLVIGYLSITNSVITKEVNKIDFISQELKIEGNYILDYSINKNDFGILEDFTKTYSNYTGNDFKIYYITGDENDIEAYFYDSSGIKNNIDYTDSDGEIKLEIKRKEHFIKTNPGKNFHYLIFYEKDGQEYVKRY